MRVKTMAVSAALAGLLASFRGHAQPGGPDFWHSGWGWGHMLFGSVMMLLFWGAIILLIAVAVRWFMRSGHEPGPPPSSSRALAILEERFARGEIDKDEFEERKRHLSG